MRTQLARAGIGVLLLLAFTLPGALRAVAKNDAAALQIRRVIETQLAAFRQGEAELAFAQAAPTIRRKFGTAATFMRMVRTAYPPVYRARNVRFGRLAAVDGQVVQEVFLTDRGQPFLALYQMQRQPGGAWKIAGVVLLKTKGKAI